MKKRPALACQTARRQLQAFHDGELSLTEQVAVLAHVEGCARCMSTLTELRVIGHSLRVLARRRRADMESVRAGLPSDVVTRLRAEDAVSWRRRVRGMFDDMHWVYPGLAAVSAALVCLVVAVSAFQLATAGSPGSDRNPVPPGARVLLPQPLAPLPPVALDDDAVFTLSGVVTRDGRVANLALLGAKASEPHDAEDEVAIARMMGAMTRTRFRPARVAGLPVAVNMVWVVTGTTVRGDGGGTGGHIHRRGVVLRAPAVARPARS